MVDRPRTRARRNALAEIHHVTNDLDTVTRNQPDNGTQLYERQRRDRSLKHWGDDDGMGTLLAKLDPVSYQQVCKAIDVEYDRLWRGLGIPRKTSRKP